MMIQSNLIALWAIGIRTKSSFVHGIGEQARRVRTRIFLSEVSGIPGMAGHRLAAGFFRALIFAGQSGDIGVRRERCPPDWPGLRHAPIAEILGDIFLKAYSVD